MSGRPGTNFRDALVHLVGLEGVSKLGHLGFLPKLIGSGLRQWHSSGCGVSLDLEDILFWQDINTGRTSLSTPN